MNTKIVGGIIGLIASVIIVVFDLKKEDDYRKKIESQDEEIKKMNYILTKSRLENECRWKKIDKIIESIDAARSEEKPKEEIKEEPKPKKTRTRTKKTEKVEETEKSEKTE